jgi:hypothetical protein
MAKVVSKSAPKFAAGGSPGSFNPQTTASANHAKPNAAVASRESAGGTDKFAKGGGPGAFNPQSTASAGPQKPNDTVVARSGDGGKFAAGGHGTMMSNRGSVPARPGKTTAY